jgi:hypothetical protein
MIGKGLVTMAACLFVVGRGILRFLNSPSRRERAERAAREHERETILTKPGPPRFNG